MAPRARLFDDIIMRGKGAGGPDQYKAEIRHGDDPAEAGEAIPSRRNGYRAARALTIGEINDRFCRQ